MIVLIGLLWLWDDDKNLRVQRGSRDPLEELRESMLEKLVAWTWVVNVGMERKGQMRYLANRRPC